ncbi:reverse transcriptase domain-containing protein [Mycobacterium sp. MS3]|uniref:RNA-directed DNA polymerase n=1 Tax=Mycobacterium sp. MS3 TaxID=3391378 RepID=UPI003988B162
MARSNPPGGMDSYSAVADKLKIDQALSALQPNDLLPPRPDDKVGGAVGERFVRAIEHSLISGRYEPETAVTVPVTKPKYATRPAALMNLIDRVVYEALVEPLRSRIERGLVSDGVVFWPRGFEMDKRWREFEALSQQGGNDYIVRSDVTGFYESIDHAVLQDILVRLTGRVDVIGALIDFLGQVMGGPRGLPQGIATSDVLATAYLSAVDAEMLRNGFDYRRHGDDIRIAVATHDDGRRAIHRLESQLRSVRLLINSDKSRVLHRNTYVTQLGAVEATRKGVHGRILKERKEALSDASDDEIERLVEGADLGVETLWALFYHRTISLEELAEKLSTHLQPDQVTVAVGSFSEAMRRMPGSGPSALAEDEFHGLVSTAMTILLAKKLPDAIESAPMLVGRFPDKTALVATYLSGLATSYPQRVETASVKALTSGYLTGWQQAWLMAVLRRVAESTRFTHFGAALEVIVDVAHDEDASWLARAEAVRLLAQVRKLDHKLLLRVWNRAPNSVRADLTAAAAVVARTEGAVWAEAFCDSMKSDPIADVVLHRVANALQQAAVAGG